MFILFPVVPTDCSDGRPSDTEELLGRHDYSAANEKDVCEEKQQQQQQQQPNSAKNSAPSSEKRQLNFEVSFVNSCTYLNSKPTDVLSYTRIARIVVARLGSHISGHTSGGKIQILLKTKSGAVCHISVVASCLGVSCITNLCAASTTQNTQKMIVLPRTHRTHLNFSPVYC